VYRVMSRGIDLPRQSGDSLVPEKSTVAGKAWIGEGLRMEHPTRVTLVVERVRRAAQGELA
jgi:hypothetical protein